MITKERILIIILVLGLIVSAFVPIVPATEPRTWDRKVTVTSIEMVPVAGEHADCAAYLMTTHTVKLNLKNTGEVYLGNLNASYQIMKQGTVLELEGFDNSQIDLAPGESTNTVGDIDFVWTPSETGTWYVINVTIVVADVFGSLKVIPLKETGLNVTINEITNKVEPTDYFLSGLPAAELNGAWPNATGNVTVIVKNLGNVNVPASTAIDVEATIYDTGGAQVWTNATTINGINAGQMLPVELKTWNPSDDIIWTLNMMTSILGTDTNLSSPLLIQDVTDAMAVSIINYQNESGYSSNSIQVTARFKNSGNRKILNQSYAKLEIRDKISNALMFENITAVPQVVGNRITKPGNTADVTFDAWNASTGITVGNYWLNVTLINTTEINGSSANNITSIWIQIGDTMAMEVGITQPAFDGMYPHTDIYRTVKAFVKNTGTLTVNGYNLTLTIKDDNSGAGIFTDYLNISAPLAAYTSSPVHTFDPWTDTYNGNFTYNVTVKFVGQSAVEHYSVREIGLAGGPGWGNISGLVTSGGVGLQGVIVGALDNGMLVGWAITDANGDYTIAYVPATTTPGTTYNVSAYFYGYQESWEPNVAVINGKDTTGVDFELGDLLPMGNITGSVTLVEVGMSDLNLDYTDILVSVKGTPRTTFADADGNFTIADVVAGKVNVTAKKANFQTDYDDNVQVIANDNVTVSLTLIENWKIEVTPAHQAVDVPTDTKIKVTFQVPMNKSTINSTTFALTDILSNEIGDPDDAGQLSWAGDNKSFEFDPPGVLESGEVYVIKLTAQATSKTGANVLHRAWRSEFTTYAIPTYISGYVLDAESGDGIFNATVRAGSAKTYSLADGSYSLLVDTPAENLTVRASAPYYFTRSEAGIDIVEGVDITNFDFSLNRNIPIRVKVEIGGVLKEIELSKTAKNIDIDTKIVVEFDEKINFSSLQLRFKTINGTTVKGNGTYDETTMTVTYVPHLPLNWNSSYDVKISDSVLNLNDEQITNWNLTWMLKTQIPPILWTVLSYGPEGVNITLNEAITATFSEVINTTSVENTFSVTPSVTGGAFAWNEAKTEFVWTHDDFEQGETYTVKIKKIAKSFLNRTGLKNYTWTFSTKPMASQKVGPIVDGDGDVVQYAEVTIINETGATVYTGKTNSEGFLVIPDDIKLEPGMYHIKVSKYGYDSISFDFEVDNDGNIVPGYNIPKLKESGEEEEEPWLAYIIIVILIVLIIIFFSLAFLGKRPVEEEYLEEEEEEELQPEGEYPEEEIPLEGEGEYGDQPLPEEGFEDEEEELADEEFKDEEEELADEEFEDEEEELADEEFEEELPEDEMELPEEEEELPEEEEEIEAIEGEGGEEEPTGDDEEDEWEEE